MCGGTVLPSVVALVLACAVTCVLAPCTAWTVWPARCTNGGLRDARMVACTGAWMVARVVHETVHASLHARDGTRSCTRAGTRLCMHGGMRPCALCMRCMDGGTRARMVACAACTALVLTRVVALVLTRAMALVLAPCMCGARTVARVLPRMVALVFACGVA